MMNVAIDGRGQVMRILHRDLDLRAFFDEADRTLGRLVRFDSSCWLSIDPATHLPTSHFSHEFSSDHLLLLATNEFLEDDVNKFRSLAAARSPVDWLDRATQQRRTNSARYREIMAPLGLGDELRAAFRAGGACWGFLCVHRQDGPHGFTPQEAQLIARLSTHVGEGLRRSLLTAAAAATGLDPDGPGVLVVDEDGSLVGHHGRR